jgi:hypothetical protein
MIIGFSPNFLKSQEILGGICCDYIQVSYEKLDSCCIEISVYNPYCYAKIVFQYYNPITDLWETKHTDDSENELTTFIICPEYGESLMNFRVKITDHSNENIWWCNPNGPIEGLNQYTFSEDASQCCDCQPLINNTWFNTIIRPNPDVCPEGCAIEHNLNIPSNITCFKYYYYENIPQNIHLTHEPFDIINLPISNFDGCLSPGEVSEARIYLLRYPEDINPCIITSIATCDTTPRPDTIPIDLPEPCLPDCQEPTDWDYRVAIYTSDVCPGCDIQVNFVTRVCDGIQQLEILALVRKSWQCMLCDKDLLMKEAFGRIIQTNPMSFEPLENGECDTTWQVGSGSCWATYPEYYMRKGNPFLDPNIDPYGFVIDSVMVSVKCDTTDCCISKFTICKDSTGLHVMNNQLPDPMLMCNYQSINIWGTEYFCLPNCTWMLIIGGYYPTSMSKIEQKNTNSDSEFFNSHSGNTIYSNGSINLEDFVQKDKHTEIKYFNLHGSQIFSRELTDTNKQFDLNTLNLNSGVYFYSILFDGKIVKTEKFIIVK